MDDLEKDHKILKKTKRLQKSLMSLLLLPFIVFSFIYFFNENFNSFLNILT